MLAVTVLTVASARLFAPAPPPAYTEQQVYAPQMEPQMVYAPQMEPQMVYVAPSSEGSAADWVLPSVAMLGLGGIFGYLATSSGEAKQAVSRRDLLGGAAAAVAMAPLAAHADGASSKATKERARAVYGSRVFRLQGKSTEAVLAEENAISIFITGSYTAGDKEVKKQLSALAKDIKKAAKAGDSAATQAALKQFITVGKIRELDIVKGGNFDPTQRRNPGAPSTSEIESQMGTQAFALYKPLNEKAPPAINKGK